MKRYLERAGIGSRHSISANDYDLKSCWPWGQYAISSLLIFYLSNHSGWMMLSHIREVDDNQRSRRLKAATQEQWKIHHQSGKNRDLLSSSLHLQETFQSISENWVTHGESQHHSNFLVHFFGLHHILFRKETPGWWCQPLWKTYYIDIVKLETFPK